MNYSELIKSNDYIVLLSELKSKIISVQQKAAIAVNSALIEFYFDLGKMIVRENKVWGIGFMEQLSKDLRAEFSGMKGFSVTNLRYCKRFYELFSIQPQVGGEILKENHPQVEADLILFSKIPWGHIKLIIDKSETYSIAKFYAENTIENNWSRDVLGLQIKSNLFVRYGRSVTNFKNTLPNPLSELAQQTLKDPYIFDFMTISQPYKERDIENELIKHITKFLLELGKGFAFVGQQYHLEIAENDYYLDLLFYHTRLKCYVVVELKNTKFIPEYAGKLNFYLSAVDSIIKDDNDNPTIGILLCRDKNNIEAEFALRDINKPIGVSEFDIIESLPENLKSNLPTIEELESELLNKWS